MRRCPVEGWIVRHADSSSHPKNAVIFANNNSGINYVDGFPYPIVITVDINTENSHIALKSFADEAIDIVTRNKCGQRG